MSLIRIEPGARYSSATIHNGTVYTSGHVATATAGRSVTEQTSEVLAALDATLAAAGTDKSKLLMVNIWLSDIATFEEMNAVWDGWIDPHSKPCRATVEARLVDPDEHIEIAAIAAL